MLLAITQEQFHWYTVIVLSIVAVLMLLGYRR